MKRLSTTERLKRRTDFRAAALGARAPAKAFVLQALDRGEASLPRVGFTVSRQVGNAAVRNRVRRRLREVVRLHPGSDLRAGHDYVLIGRRAALQAPFDAMMRDFDAALRRVHTGGGAARRAGTGDGDSSPLHKAGSPARPHRPRREQRRTTPPIKAQPTRPKLPQQD